MKADTLHMKPVSFLLTLFLGPILGSCASTSPGDLENQVQVFNVYREQGDELPKTVEGCEYLGGVYASAPAPAESSATVSMVSADPEQLLETIRARAYRKGADTAFLSLAPLAEEDTLRATIFRCGDSEVPAKFGLPVRRGQGDSR